MFKLLQASSNFNLCNLCMSQIVVVSFVVPPFVAFTLWPDTFVLFIFSKLYLDHLLESNSQTLIEFNGQTVTTIIHHWSSTATVSGHRIRYPGCYLALRVHVTVVSTRRKSPSENLQERERERESGQAFFFLKGEPTSLQTIENRLDVLQMIVHWSTHCTFYRTVCRLPERTMWSEKEKCLRPNHFFSSSRL